MVLQESTLLALLDGQQSSWNKQTNKKMRVVRIAIGQISSKLQFMVALGHMPSSVFNTARAFNFWKKTFSDFSRFFPFSLTWDPMGAKFSKPHPSLKSLLNFSKLFLNFLLNSPHYKVLFCIFDILSFGFLKIIFPEISHSPLHHIGKPKGAVLSKRSHH